LKHVRVFNGLARLPPSTVYLSSGHIVPFLSPHANATVIDGTGQDLTLLPGFFDAHAHPETMDDLLSFARNGVTTVMDMACFTRAECLALVRERADDGLPSVFVSGATATTPGSTNANLPGFPANETINTGTREEMHSWVQSQLDKGASYIKLIQDRPGRPQLSPEEVKTLVQASTARGLKTNCHTVAYDSVGVAVEAGVNMLHHLPFDKSIDPDLAYSAKRAQTISVPTLTMMRAFGAIMAPGTYDVARESVRTLHEAGVPILADANAVNKLGIPTLPPPISYGPSLHDELANLVEAGLTPVEALRSATILPSLHFGLTPDRGAVLPGMRADLVLVEGDPTKDISTTRSIRKVWIGGVE
ncbi:putative hydrolase, partial [Exidia glandulosa HHB12029]